MQDCTHTQAIHAGHLVKRGTHLSSERKSAGITNLVKFWRFLPVLYTKNCPSPLPKTTAQLQYIFKRYLYLEAKASNPQRNHSELNNRVSERYFYSSAEDKPKVSHPGIKETSKRERQVSSHLADFGESSEESGCFRQPRNLSDV